MKQVTQVMATLTNQPPEPVRLPTKLDPATVEVVNKLFTELQCIFPAWRQAWPTDKAMGRAKRSWVKGLFKAGINSLEQLRWGVEACRELGEDFAPSVGRFIRMCVPKPTDLGMPDEESAWREVVRGSSDPERHRWSHEAVHLAGRAAGWFHLRRGSLSEETLRKRFGHAYHQLLRRVAMGLPLEEPRQALEDQSEGRELTPEQADRRGEWLVQALMRDQGLADLSGEQARQQLLARFGRTRGERQV